MEETIELYVNASGEMIGVNKQRPNRILVTSYSLEGPCMRSNVRNLPNGLALAAMARFTFS